MQMMIGLFGIGPPLFKGDVFLGNQRGLYLFLYGCQRGGLWSFVVVNVDWIVGWRKDMTPRHSVVDDAMNMQ